jgi:MFS family permease
MSYAFTSDERRTISILSFGTFLEYFDLFLFVHLASKINETFFAPGDKSSFLVTSIAYITSNLFRPFGALILGYLGDKIGRVYTLYVTLCLMGFIKIIKIS